MGAKKSKLNSSQMKSLCEQTDFDEGQIEKFHRNFKKNFPKGRVTKKEFRKLYKQVYPTGDAGPIADQMFRVYDTDQNGYIDFREFLCGLGLLARGTFEQKMRIIFRIYDIDNNGHISKWELEAVLGALIKAVEPAKREDALSMRKLHEQSKAILDSMGNTGNDQVTYEQFVEGVKRDPNFVHFLTSSPPTTPKEF